MVKKHFASALRFLEAYQQEGCDGDNVKVYERELKKIELLKNPQRVHRGAVITSDDEDDDHETPKIKRNKFKTFLKKFVDIPGTQTIPQAEAPSVPAEVVSNYNDIYLEAVGGDDVPGTQRIPPAEDPVVPMEVTTESEDENDIGLEGFADALEDFEFRT